MKEIRIKVPNKSITKEWEVCDAVSRLLEHFNKKGIVSIEQGQGGSLDDWKEPDLKYRDGLLMVFRVKKTKKYSRGKCKHEINKRS